MKKISNILLAVTFALPLFTACETDNDSNPILNEPDTFTLNTPAYAANNVYDLKNAQSVELTCSQPDYGFPAATKPLLNKISRKQQMTVKPTILCWKTRTRQQK